MTTPQPPPTTPPAPPSVLGAFTPLAGGGGAALAAGPASAPVMSLNAGHATWWSGGAATTVSWNDAGPVHGSVWIDGGKRLRVGLGTLDLAAKSFAIEPALQPFVKDVKQIRQIAWFPDGQRVALLVEPKGPLVDRPAPAGYDRNKRELVIVSLAGAEPAARGVVTVKGTPVIAAGDDRVMVAGNDTQMFNLRAEPLDVAFTARPEFASHVSFDAGRFVHVRGNGTITLVEARSGATVATWGGEGISDAVARGNTIVSVGSDATVHVGCLAGGKVTEVAKASAGKVANRVQIVGDRVVVEAEGPDPIRVATLTPCAP